MKKAIFGLIFSMALSLGAQAVTSLVSEDVKIELGNDKDKEKKKDKKKKKKSCCEGHGDQKTCSESEKKACEGKKEEKKACEGHNH